MIIFIKYIIAWLRLSLYNIIDKPARVDLWYKSKYQTIPTEEFTLTVTTSRELTEMIQYLSNKYRSTKITDVIFIKQQLTDIQLSDNIKE